MLWPSVPADRARYSSYLALSDTTYPSALLFGVAPPDAVDEAGAKRP